MPSRVAAALILLLALVHLAPPAESAAQPAAKNRPKLAVLIVVDQMRADYVDRFRGDWTGGLNRMVKQGAWFRRAAYPYLTTVTCAGHATISTGAFPHTHGIVQNAWWDRAAKATTTCTNDPDATAVSYGPPSVAHESAHYLAVPTFTDVMRSQRGAHVVTLSLKARSAIMLAGHGADAATWLNDSLDGFLSSSVYGEGPVPAVKAFVDAHAINADFGKTWDRLLPADRYHEADDAVGEAPMAGWTRTFPHPLRDAGNAPNAGFRTLWERSPYADAYLGSMAASLVDAMRLGQHEGTDVLGVSFSSPDLVGHAFGPDSQEIHDMYDRLDRTIGVLLERLDASVGAGKYVVALTADHGVTEIPEQRRQSGRDGGRLDAATLSAIIETRARAIAGPGQYVANESGNDVYFEPGMYDRVAANKAAIDAILSALRSVQGIAAVFQAEQVRGGAASSDPLLRAAALSYFPGRSGDLILVPKAGWMFSKDGTTHGTADEDDQRVPILLFGDGIKPGSYASPATPADIAPTLAAICGVKLPQAEGHALAAALR
jgi:predicted AlkP superfamily pyrophosphatase or phosphodiesterase